MLELHKKKNSLPPSAEREKIEREIAVTDEKIDDIVYELYGITGEERKIMIGGWSSIFTQQQFNIVRKGNCI
jgi:hypothetical protein